MTGGSLLLLMLLVSSASLLLQGAALILLLHQHPVAGTERLATRGYVRTAACRVADAVVYVTVAAVQMAGARVNGGDLTPEALVIFSGVQLLWLGNAAADILTRRRLRTGGSG
jgi:hypothetical protein